LHDEWKQLT